MRRLPYRIGALVVEPVRELNWRGRFGYAQLRAIFVA